MSSLLDPLSNNPQNQGNNAQNNAEHDPMEESETLKKLRTAWRTCPLFTR